MLSPTAYGAVEEKQETGTSRNVTANKAVPPRASNDSGTARAVSAARGVGAALDAGLDEDDDEVFRASSLLSAVDERAHDEAAGELVESLSRSGGSLRVRCQPSSHDSDGSSGGGGGVRQQSRRRKSSGGSVMELLQGSSLESVTGEANDSFVATHYEATPTLPRNVAHLTPSRRLSSRTYDVVAASRGSVSRPDYDDCLRRTAAVVHKHVHVCERRRARAVRRSPETLDTGQFRDRASACFEESRYISPQYAYACVRMPLMWTGLSYTMRKVKQSYAMPSMRDIYSFLSTLFLRAHLSSECSIVCLIYVERLMEKANVPLLRSTWRPIMLCSMLLASKVWQDCASWNVEFTVVFPQFTLAAINSLERNFVAALGWDMYISQSLYAKYYFALRSLNERHDFRRRYNHFVMATHKEQPRDAINVQMRSHKLRTDWSKVLSKSL